MKYPGLVSAIAMSILLASCGGGGGDKGGDDGGHAAANEVTLSKAPGLQLSSQAVSIGMEVGDDVPLAFVDGVVNEAKAPVYVYVQTTNHGIGTVRFQQMSDIGGRLHIDARSNLPPGTYQDEIRIDVCYDASCRNPVLGSPKLIQTSFRVRAAMPVPTMLLNRYGVALAKVPAGEHLAQDITVEQSGSGATGWIARSNQPWLQVPAQGSMDSPLRIQANPAGLAPGHYQGLVGVGPAQEGSARPAYVRVGLYVSATASSAEFDAEVGDGIQVDPARPYVYSIKDSKILIDHVHTGQRIASVGVPGIRLGEMTMNPEGSRLVAINAEGTRAWIFDTDARQFIGVYDLPAAQGGDETRRTPLIFKVNGSDMLVVVGLQTQQNQVGGYAMLDLATGRTLNQVFPFAWQYNDVRVAEDGRHFVVHTARLSPNSMYWGEWSVNSKGRAVLSFYDGGSLSGSLMYLNTDYFIASSGTETISCQGLLWWDQQFPYPGQSARVDTEFIKNFTWRVPRPNYADERLKCQCTSIEPYLDGDQFLMTDADATEFQARRRDGSLVASWSNDRGLTGLLKLSSDQLRAHDGKRIMDLTLPR